MRILIGTNHFQEYAGSELVVLEMAECFFQEGCSVTICANFVADPMKKAAESSGISTLIASEDINAFDFDLVLTINQIAPLFTYKESKEMREHTRFIFLHVDINFCLSQLGLIHEPILADEVWFNSEEMKDHFVAKGSTIEKSYIFYNAAPSRFWLEKRPYNSKISNILMISNHLPEELKELKVLLKKKGISVKHIGQNGDEYGRIGPKILNNSDVVISIGKTAQYCVAHKTPFFVYDHFGGPGYLTPDNFERASRFNFSGRCCETKKSAEQLVDELDTGYCNAVKFFSNLENEKIGKFRLRPQIISLLSRVSESQTNSERLSLIENYRQEMEKEQALARGAAMFYRMWRGAHLTVEHYRSKEKS